MDLGTFQYYFQLKLPHADIVPGGLIALLTRGGLKQPTQETLEKVIRLNGYFDELHGRGTSTKESKHTLIKTNKFLARRCPDIDERLVKAFAKVKYTKKIKDKYEEILMKRRLAAKMKGKKLKSNRDHLKDGQLRCQSKLPEIEVNTEYFYDTMFGSDENLPAEKSTAKQGGRAKDVEIINMQPSEVVEVAVEEAEVAVEEAEVAVEAKRGRGKKKVEHEESKKPAPKRRKIQHKPVLKEVVKAAVETNPKGRRGKKAAAEAEEGMRETGSVSENSVEEKPAAEEASKEEEDSQKPAAEVHEQVVAVSPVE